MRSHWSQSLIVVATLAVAAGCDDGAVSVGARLAAPQPKLQTDEADSAPALPIARVQPGPPEQTQDRLLTVLIGGFDSDPTPEQIEGTAPRGTGRSGLYQLARDLEEQGIATRFFNWDGSAPGAMGKSGAPGASAIAAYLRNYHNEHPDVPLVVVGNSWGGQTAMEVVTLLAQSDEPTPITQLLLTDASSFLRSMTGLPAVPQNVLEVTNYFTHNAITTGPLDDERVENIDLGDPDTGFLRDDWARYDAANEWRAHILVEWDPLIHQDIQRRIVEVAGN